MTRKIGVSKTKSVILVIVTGIIYLILFAMVVLLGRGVLVFPETGFAMQGVLTALQFLLAIIMTVGNYHFGGCLAVILLVLSSGSAVSVAVVSRDLSSLPGICYYVAGLMAVTIIQSGMSRERRHAYLDALTGIDNRRSLIEHMEKRIHSNSPFYLLYLDLDHFKYINDSEGHERGDQILKQVVSVWKEIRVEDSILGRWGGDEFICLIPKKKEMNIKEIVQQYVKALDKLDEENLKVRMFLSVSVGYAEFPDDATNVNDILRKADIAMYAAKNAGRNQLQRYDASFDKKIIRAQNIEVIIREALLHERFYLVYQPQFYSKTQKIRGFEALIRLNNGNGEKIGPAEFIPVAEQSELIVDIGEFVLRRALLDFAPYMRVKEGILLSVNISAKQMMSKGFVESVKYNLERTGFPVECLELEITEYCFLDETEEAILIINRLKKLGIKIAMDDFGVGYSSLSYLTKLPIDLIKIDKSLVDTMNEGAIVQALISMGHALGCEIIAEGVEYKEQLDVLRSMGCDFIQGYLLCKPIVFDQVHKYLD